MSKANRIGIGKAFCPWPQDLLEKVVSLDFYAGGSMGFPSMAVALVTLW